MNDNERIEAIRRFATINPCRCRYSTKATEHIVFLIDQLEKRDKTIVKQQELATIARELLSQIKIEMAEKDEEIKRLREYVEQLKHERDMLEEQLGIPQSLVQDAEGRSVREIAENVAERNDGAMKRMEDGSQ